MDDANTTEAPRGTWLLISAIVTVVVLMVLLGLAVFLFGDEATGGPTQFAIAFAGAFAAVLARFHGFTWEQGQLLLEGFGPGAGQRSGQRRRRDWNSGLVHPACGRRADRDLGHVRDHRGHDVLRPGSD